MYYIDEILSDQNDINESTRAQLDAISTALAALGFAACYQRDARNAGFKVAKCDLKQSPPHRLYTTERRLVPSLIIIRLHVSGHAIIIHVILRRRIKASHIVRLSVCLP